MSRRSLEDYLDALIDDDEPWPADIPFASERQRWPYLVYCVLATRSPVEAGDIRAAVACMDELRLVEYFDLAAGRIRNVSPRAA